MAGRTYVSINKPQLSLGRRNKDPGGGCVGWLLEDELATGAGEGDALLSRLLAAVTALLASGLLTESGGVDGGLKSLATGGGAAMTRPSMILTDHPCEAG